MDESIRIFIEIIIPLITAILGFFGGKVYQAKITNKKTNINGNKGNKVNAEEINEVTQTGEKSTSIIASGENSQAAGRDIVNDRFTQD